jgi:hypothetical protein
LIGDRNSKKAMTPPDQPGEAFPGKLVFPNSQNAPSLLLQDSSYQPVPDYICGQLFPPKGPIRGGNTRVFWATMPEAAIDEDRDPGNRKDEIGFAKHRPVAAPGRSRF